MNFGGAVQPVTSIYDVSILFLGARSTVVSEMGRKMSIKKGDSQ